MIRSFVKSTLTSKQFARSCWYFKNIYSMAEAPSPKKMKLDDELDVESKQVDNVTDNTILQPDVTEGTQQRLIKRKCIILLSYCGKGYMGMQRNPGVLTIEEELLQALSKAEAIPENLKGSPGKLSFQRCARTDKGVSAARQVVSLKMVPDPGLIPKINMNLPDQIRVVAIKKVTKGFDSKKACTSRVYEYLLPTYTVAPFEDTNLKYRINATVITRLQKLLNCYIGTHNFHNFTAQKLYEDPSAKRYIMSFNVGDPFVRGDVEFVSLTVEGQSFMLHQIRKMIGYVIAIMRGFTNEILSEAFNKPKLDIPRAPPLGLLLDSVNYKTYNLRFGEDGVHEKLDWLEYEDVISAFKEDHIYKIMIDTEIRELQMMKWLEGLHIHNFHQTKQRLAEIEMASKQQLAVVDDGNIDNIEQLNSNCCDGDVTEKEQVVTTE